MASAKRHYIDGYTVVREWSASEKRHSWAVYDAIGRFCARFRWGTNPEADAVAYVRGRLGLPVEPPTLTYAQQIAKSFADAEAEGKPFDGRDALDVLAEYTTAEEYDRALDSGGWDPCGSTDPDMGMYVPPWTAKLIDGSTIRVTVGDAPMYIAKGEA